MKRMNPTNATTLKAALLALACTLGASLAAGQDTGAQALKGVSDPTRPPPGAMRAPDGPRDGAAANGAAGSPAATALAASAVEAPLPPLQLNAIRFDMASATGVALINGKLVQAGDMVEGRTVLAVQRDAVLLSERGKAGKSAPLRLSLLPDTPPSATHNKETKRPTAARAAARGRKERT
jgi:hypothetical protein